MNQIKLSSAHKLFRCTVLHMSVLSMFQLLDFYGKVLLVYLISGNARQQMSPRKLFSHCCIHFQRRIRTQSNIYDGDFLRKLLTAFVHYCAQEMLKSLVKLSTFLQCLKGENNTIKNYCRMVLQWKRFQHCFYFTILQRRVFNPLKAKNATI